MRWHFVAWTAAVMVALGAGCGSSDSEASTKAAPAAAAKTTAEESVDPAVSAALTSTAEPTAAAPVKVAQAPAETTAAPAKVAAPATRDAAAPAAGAPRIVIEEKIHNFGVRDAGEKIEHTWIIRNDGAVDLEITDVRPACGCTNTNLADKVVPPGGSTTLSSVLELPRQVGPVKKNIAITSNDPKEGTIVVAFEGEATQAIGLDPYVLTFRDIGADEVTTLVAEVTATDPDTTFSIERLTMDQDQFDTAVETVEEGRHYRVSVTTRPPFLKNYITDRVYIHTDHPKLKVLQLSTVANVLTELVTAPDVIRLSGQHLDPIKRMVLVRAGSVSTFTITGVELPDPEMTYEVIERQPGMVYVEIDNIVAKPELDGKELIVRTDVASLPEIRVPFQVVGAGGAPFPTISTAPAKAPAE